MACFFEIKGLTFFFSRDYISFLFSVAGEKRLWVCDLIRDDDHVFLA